MVDGVSVAVWRGCRPELGSAGWWIWIMEAGPVEATQELGAGTSVPELSPTPRPGETWSHTYTVYTLYITLHPYTAILRVVMDQAALITIYCRVKTSD